MTTLRFRSVAIIWAAAFLLGGALVAALAHTLQVAFGATADAATPAVAAGLTLDHLANTGVLAAPAATLVQIVVSLIASIAWVRGRAPWLDGPRARAVVAVAVADLALFWPSVVGGAVTWWAAVIVIGAHAGQVMRPDALPVSRP